MADREKVMRGLELCACTDCVGCPYRGVSPCQNKLAADALAMLREQEPRVMTLEEVIHSKDWIWYQWKNTHCGWTIAVDCDEEWIGWEDLTVDQLCKYGKKWRCWTSRPTPDQMRDTPWEGEKE